MIKNIFEMLQVTEYYGQSENIEIAKGKFMISKTVKEILEQTRREIKFKKAQKNGRA